MLWLIILFALISMLGFILLWCCMAVSGTIADSEEHDCGIRRS